MKKSIIYILSLAFALGACQNRSTEMLKTGSDWPYYLGDNENNHYSPLSQINTENVKKLQIAWTYNTGDDVKRNDTQIQCNPIVIDGVLYGSSPRLKIFAVNAATGKQIWEFDPAVSTHFALNTNR